MATGPASRTTSARSPGSPGATPVWAGLTTATRSPAAWARAATAAVTTVLPTPVPVPVTIMWRTPWSVTRRGGAVRGEVSPAASLHVVLLLRLGWPYLIEEDPA